MTTINTAGRFVGDWPRIGIRPAVDGRQHGVRESLEEQTRAMALRTAALIRDNLRYPDGTPVEVVVPDHNIGGVSEAAKTAELFRKEGVGVSLTVTPCWCYGSETMDMDPLTPKAVWGFNGTERPGAVYLAAVLAAHTQKGLPAFGIYGRDVQDADDGSIPADVQEKILRFARAGLAAALLRGKSYLSLGGVSMGIAGSIVDQPFFEKYLGMRVECVDMSELTRRLEEEIYDPVEFAAALAWAKANCTEGTDRNTPDKQKTREEKDRDWETVVKMTLIARDLMVGNPRLAELGFGEEAHGPQRDPRRLPGPAPVDRPLAQRRLHGGDPQLVVRLERHPRAARLRDRERQPQRRDDAAVATCSRTRPRSSPTSAPTGAPRRSSASPGRPSRASPPAASST